MHLVATVLFFTAGVLRPVWAVASKPASKPAQKLPVNSGIHSVSPSLKYLIATFPDIKTVAYTHLPDTVWRPLYVGTLERPVNVATDAVHQRLFVSDQKLNKIFVYGLIIEKDGLLKTDGFQRVAVNEMNATWMNVNGVGDLYFNGKATGAQGSDAGPAEWAVYRMDAGKISSGIVTDPIPIYTRSNSGFPTSAVWMPSGIAVDSFNVYWGNAEDGKKHGALCSGTRQNIGVTAGIEVNVFSRALNEVRGIAVTGQSVYYLAPTAVYGLSKSGWTDPLIDASIGKMQEAPDGSWDAKSIAFDGETTLYWTETKTGAIYSVPAADTNFHPLVKYVDAPQVYGVTVFSLAGLTHGQVQQEETKMYSTNSATAEDSGAQHMWNLCPMIPMLAVLIAAFLN